MLFYVPHVFLKNVDKWYRRGIDYVTKSITILVAMYKQVHMELILLTLQKIVAGLNRLFFFNTFINHHWVPAQSHSLAYMYHLNIFNALHLSIQLCKSTEQHSLRSSRTVL